MNNTTKIVENINIADVVNQYIELEKKGANYVGICPFHDDTSPSLTVNNDKRIFKCFVCNTGGNAINFVEKFEKIPYNLALKKIAEQNNIQIEQTVVKKSVKTAEKFLMEDLLDFYHTNLLASEEAEAAEDYLAKRNYSFEVISEYKLGFSPNDSENLRRYLDFKIEKEENYTQYTIEQLKIFSNKGRDSFSGRLVIPIFDQYGDVVGFSGRTIGNSNIKYINSLDSKVFNKNRLLYNFHRAKEYADDQLIIVEGFFDVIRLAEKGFKNAIALMGTALTTNHVKMLEQLKVSKITLCLDNDNAGQSTTAKLAKRLLMTKFEVRIVEMKGAKDVDEYLEKFTTTDFQNLLDNALSYNEFAIQFYSGQFDLSNLTYKQQYIDEVLYGLTKYNEITKMLIIDQVAELTQVRPEILMKIADNIKFEQKPVFIDEFESLENDQSLPIELESQFQAQNQVINKRVKNVEFADIEDYLLSEMLSNKQVFEQIQQKIRANNFKFKRCNELYIALTEYYTSSIESQFDYIEFIDKNPVVAQQIDQIKKKYLFEENIDIDNLLNNEQKRKNSKWNLFKKL
ncbi:MAG: DNA primase [Mycoplasmatales bacterium]